MKKTIFTLAIAMLVAGTIFTACQSSAEKVENAEEKVENAKEDLAQSERDLYQTKLDTITNYEQFKIEAEKIITVQAKNIAEFKSDIAIKKEEAKTDLDKKLVELENKNKELEKKLADFKDDGKYTWITFKNEFNHDMDELGRALKDLTVDNTK